MPSPIVDDIAALNALSEECWHKEESVAGLKKLNVNILDDVRSQIADFCFSNRALVQQKAFRCLLQVLEAMPVGHPFVANGLITLLKRFKTELPAERLESMSLDAFTKAVRCVFVLVEAIRAEHAVTNLPAMSKQTRDDFQDYIESVQRLNVTSEGSSMAAMFTENASLELRLWFDALDESSKRLQVDESKAEVLLTQAADVAGGKSQIQ